MQNSLDKCLDDLDSPNASARVEITPEMIEAGEVWLDRYDPDFSDSGRYLREIFLRDASCSASSYSISLWARRFIALTLPMRLWNSASVMLVSRFTSIFSLDSFIYDRATFDLSPPVR